MRLKKMLVAVSVIFLLAVSLSSDILDDIKKGKTEKIIGKIRKGKLDFNKPVKGAYPLLRAMMRRNEKLVKFMLENGADLSVRTESGQEGALHLAAKWNRPELIKTLLEKGMKPDDQDRNGYTPLMILCEKRAKRQNFILSMMDTYYRTGKVSKADFQTIFTKYGVESDSIEGDAFESFLGLANPSAYQLLKNGANPNLGTKYKKPIDLAFNKGKNILLGLLLIEKGVDVEKAMEKALAFKQIALAEKLIEKGAKPPAFRYCISKITGMKRNDAHLKDGYLGFLNKTIEKGNLKKPDLYFAYDRVKGLFFYSPVLSADEVGTLYLRILKLLPVDMITKQEIEPHFDLIHEVDRNLKNRDKLSSLMTIIKKLPDMGFDTNLVYKGRQRMYMYGGSSRAFEGWTQEELDLFKGRGTPTLHQRLTPLEFAVVKALPQVVEMLLTKYKKTEKSYKILMLLGNKGKNNPWKIKQEEFTAILELLKKHK